MIYKGLSVAELQQELTNARSEFENLQKEKLNVDISRGKPCGEQLDLSMEMLTIISDTSKLPKGADIRNYGGIEGIMGMRELFAELLGVSAANVIVGGNSSLNMMFDTVARCMQFGVLGGKPWNSCGKIKFLCPAPGYDRHFAICKTFGIEMITIPMDENGPIMDIVEDFVANDENIKGIWCVPKYSNPTGITYSEEVVNRLASMVCKASDFRIFWDNAYCVHDLLGKHDELKNIFLAAKENGNEDRIYEFTSTSKITFPGAGIGCMAGSEKNIQDALKILKFQTIGPDKINQYAHLLFLKDKTNIVKLMEKQAEIITPKFEKFIHALGSEFENGDIASWTNPNGGYFISFNVLNGCAKRVGALCKEAGLVITTVGDTYPYGIDDNDSNIRIAPTYTATNEIDSACKILINATKIACIEKLVNNK